MGIFGRKYSSTALLCSRETKKMAPA